MLEIKNLSCGYGELKVLFDLNLSVNENEVIALVGSNGAGKSTLLSAISGIIPITSGSVTWFGDDLTKMPAFKRAELGIAHIPQGRGILSTLSIKDNLMLGTYTKRTKKRREELLQRSIEVFPILGKRLNQQAGSLSGGQQQMLAIGRALMMEEFKSQGVSMLIIEQNLVKALKLADMGYVLETGKIVLSGKSAELLVDPTVRTAYLGV